MGSGFPLLDVTAITIYICAMLCIYFPCLHHSSEFSTREESLGEYTAFKKYEKKILIYYWLIS